MKRLALLLPLLLLAACGPHAKSTKQVQSDKAAEAANSISFSQNAEIDNIKRRLELTSDPGAVGFIVLLNQSGQPIAYYGVKGKVTSSGKRLTRADEIWSTASSEGIRGAASDEGTFGSSDPYIYFWTAEGRYVQWSGEYIYSDKPLRLSVKPLVVSAVVTP